jgi:hypothetical protein
MSVELVRTLLAQLGTLTFVAAGFVLILAGVFPAARAWAGRLMLLGALLAVVAGLVTPDWLP